MRWFDKYTLSLLCLLLSTNFFKTFLSYQQNTNSLSSPFFVKSDHHRFFSFFPFFVFMGVLVKGSLQLYFRIWKKKKDDHTKHYKWCQFPLSPPLLLCRKFREWNLLQSKKLKSKLTKPCDHIRTKCAISSCFFFFQIFVLFFVCFLGSFQSCGSWTKPFRSTK